MIEVKNLFHKYDNQSEYAVNDVSFKINNGEIFGFLGPSGAGKSTVQNIMTGLLELQNGDVLYNNSSLDQMEINFFNKIGVSFEHPNLYSKLSGYENLKYYAGLFDVPTKKPESLLNEMGLKEAADKKAKSYSKGMKQRLVFARALLNDPEILFLDEPLSGLDPSTAREIKNIIINKKKNGTTIFLTTHNMFVAEELCDKVAFINEGEIVALDTPRNLKLKYGNKSVKVEYKQDANLQKEYLFPENKEDNLRLKKLIGSNNIETIHSQEATLEQIFIKITGRELA